MRTAMFRAARCAEVWIPKATVPLVARSGCVASLSLARRDRDLGVVRGRLRAAHACGASDDTARPAAATTRIQRERRGGEVEGGTRARAATAATAAVVAAPAATASYGHSCPSAVTARASGPERAREAGLGTRALHGAAGATG